MTVLWLIAVAWAGGERANVVRSFDHDSNGRLDKPELVAMSRQAAASYASLLGFCDVAKGDPAAHGVTDLKARCDDGRVDAPWLRAWESAG